MGSIEPLLTEEVVAQGSFGVHVLRNIKTLGLLAPSKLAQRYEFFKLTVDSRVTFKKDQKMAKDIFQIERFNE